MLGRSEENRGMAFSEQVRRGYKMARAWFNISLRMEWLCFTLRQSPLPSFCGWICQYNCTDDSALN